MTWFGVNLLATHRLRISGSSLMGRVFRPILAR